MARLTESGRERELYRYYQPADDIPPLSKDTLRVVPAPRSSSDLSLTAFAQLGALRLNAKRCIISLVGQHTEYILAEAGQTLSLQDDTRHDADDGLWHGVGALTSKAGIGPVVMEHLTNSSTEHLPHLIIEDLSKDDRFRDLPIVKDGPHARFLACFPLRTPTGFIIGLYIVIDDKPRERVSKEEVYFLQDMAITVMDVVAVGRTKAKHHRSERMIKALGLFLEGGESIRDWWITQGQQGHSMQQIQMKDALRRGVTFADQADVEFGIQEGEDGSILSDAVMEARSENTSGPPSSKGSAVGDGRPPMPPSMVSSTISESSSRNHTSRPKHLDGKSSMNTSLSNDPPFAKQSNIEKVTAQEDAKIGGKRLQEALLSEDLRRSFSRASNLIREAMDVEGVAFFDASIGSFAGGSEISNMNAKAPGAHIVNGKDLMTTTTSDSDSRDKSSTDEGKESVPEQDSSNTLEASASILGYSTRKRSSLKGHLSSQEQCRFKETILRHMAKRYPHGKVFDFLEDGTISSSDSESPTSATKEHGIQANAEIRRSKKKSKKRNTKETEAKAIQEMFPGARSVAWFPLWDTSLERWYAGTMVWSTKPTRVFDPEEDLTYLAAFGNSIMAEVSRLTTAVTSQLKVDFISSISHELRSPLHGILASVEFLQEESNMTNVQSEMIQTIQSCGSMLLETIDHVLDFSKINKRLKDRKSNSKRRRSRQAKSISRGRQGAKSPSEEESDLKNATEEVVDSIFAARFVKQAGAENGAPESSAVVPAAKQVPLVIVDMKYHDDWLFQIESGAWRRMVMNIFSNALKYTQRGFVHLELSIGDEGKSRAVVTLRIRDSGKGISREFLNTHLYTAFKQENSLNTGTGLGLNIVRQMALDLGGQINITSEVSSGTEAILSLPLIVGARKSSKENSLLAVRSIFHGVNACIVNHGFHTLPDIHEEATGILTPEAEALLLLKLSIHSMMIDWFGIDVTMIPEINFSSAELLVTMAFDGIDDLLQNLGSTSDEIKPNPTVIIIRQPYSGHSNYATDSGVQVINVSLPVTVQKMINALSAVKSSETESGLAETTTKATSQTSTTPLDRVPSCFDDEDCKDYFTRPINKPGVASPPISPGTMRRKRETATTVSQTQFSTPSSASSDGSINQSDELPFEVAKFNVLLVEDNPINLKILVTCMSKLSHNYTTAIHGLEAVDAFQRQDAPLSPGFSKATMETRSPFDIILMDLQMPVMDGLAATREIRAYERTNFSNQTTQLSTIIALTAATSHASKQEAFSSGVDVFLSKPLSMKTLRAVLESYRNGGREGVKAEWANSRL